MAEILFIIKIVLCTASFILLCVAALKLNLNPADRAKQFLMPAIALIYGILALIFINDLYLLLDRGINFLERHISFINDLHLHQYMIYLVNALTVLGFILVKAIILPILKRIWEGSENVMKATSGHFYEYEKDLDVWVLKPDFGQVKFYYKGIWIAAIVVSSAVFVLSQYFPEAPFFQTAFYPIFGVLILGEVVSVLSGLTKNEFMEDILGEDEESYKIANYGLLRDVLRNLFGSHVLYDATVDSGLAVSPAYETLEEMCASEDPAVANLGQYFRALKESGRDVDSSYVKSCIKLVKGESVLFCDPFYRDLTDYVLIPMLGRLMRYRKCLVVMGRESSTDDVKEWLEQGIIEQINTDSLWKVDILGHESTDADIGILKFSDLFNFAIQKKNEDFFQKVGFVFIVEPSKLLATGQVGLNMLVGRFEESNKVVYAACDRNCDGLVDALSHTLRTNITEVAATSPSSTVTSMMCWDADGEYMHHKIFSNISRYLGGGTEINSVAMKYQIADTRWISGEKFPVIDIKWIAGQYYKKICGYADLPVSQETFNKAFQVDPGLWDMSVRENAFLVVEDEFQNLFEMVRLFSTRAKSQGFVNVISENYLLRDYMLDNALTFISDPKAIPTIVADYARTERNTVLKLLIRMAGEQVGEEEIAEALTVSGIDFESPVDALKELIRKHCSIDDISLRVYFREVTLEDGIRTETKKYYTIAEENEAAEFVRNLRNAYYIAEDEKGETYYIGAKLYGHVFQALIPGQFLTYDGKYYEVQSITSHNGVVVRRAADHITGRKYYRQIRHIILSDWKDDGNVGGQKTIGDIRLSKGYSQIKVYTEGYLEMPSWNDLKAARHIHVSGVPVRSYKNKLVMKIVFPGASERIRYTICLLMNEIFRTTYPDAYPYICALTQLQDDTKVPESLKYAMYTMESEQKDAGIYIIEDSDIDLGLTASVERNLERYLEIISEVLSWHEAKMKEKPEKKEPAEEFKPEFPPEPEKPEKKKGIFQRVWEKIKSIFKRKPKTKEPESEEPVNGTEPEGDGPEKTSGEDKKPEPDKLSSEEQRETAKNRSDVLHSESQTSAGELDIQGIDEELIAHDEEMTEYQKKCFLKFGYSVIDTFLDLTGTAAYLAQYGYDRNPLQQVRDNEKAAEEYGKTYDPQKPGAHFCDFCWNEIAGGEYEILKDGRERCSHCSATALRTGEQFKEVFKMVLRNMEIFYGIKINTAIKVRMTDAGTIAKHFGKAFVPTPGVDGRTLGFAQRDSSGYSIYIENGSPKLAAMATIAHELTHIWQYQNWDEKAINDAYGAHNSLEVYEGMAKWAEIQYLLYLNETAYGKREEILTMLRQDEYGRGFIQYRKKYGLSYSQEKKVTPFQVFPPL